MCSAQFATLDSYRIPALPTQHRLASTGNAFDNDNLSLPTRHNEPVIDLTCDAGPSAATSDPSTPQSTGKVSALTLEAGYSSTDGIINASREKRGFAVATIEGNLGSDSEIPPPPKRTRPSLENIVLPAKERGATFTARLRSNYCPSISLTANNSPPKAGSSSATSFTGQAQAIDLVDDSDHDNSDDDLCITQVRKLDGIPKTRQINVPRILHQHTQTWLQPATQNGVRLQAGSVVEFSDGTFMKIRDIEPNQRDGLVLIGFMYTRSGARGPVMPRKRNALVWEPEDENTSRDTRIPLHYRGSQLLNEVVQRLKTVTGEHENDFGLWRRLAEEVIGHRTLTITNAPYDDKNCITCDLARALGESQEDIERDRVLICRWRDITRYDESGKWLEQILIRPEAEQICGDSGMALETLRTDWRGETRPISQHDHYTFADAFCGAGGVSTGADQAGFKVVIAFDKDKAKIATYRRNFPHCKALVLTVTEFIFKAQQKGWRVDVLHLSPPCQPFSIANVTPNELKNEVNQPPLLGCADVIRSLKPRIVTVEEAPGIVQRHHPWFYALVNQFTDLGFSLRWTYLNCAEYGVPQSRKRFFIIAAAPGEHLPSFPKPSCPSGTVTIRDALVRVEAAHAREPLPHHNPSIRFTVPKPSFNPDRLANTITCNGGQNNYHPSGLRNYTLCEFMVLQTFPLRYKVGTKEDGTPLTAGELKTQCGNAVPPAVAKAVLISVMQSLRKTDQKRRLTMSHEIHEDAIWVD